VQAKAPVERLAQTLLLVEIAAGTGVHDAHAGIAHGLWAVGWPEGSGLPVAPGIAWDLISPLALALEPLDPLGPFGRRVPSSALRAFAREALIRSSGT